jgi:hypothetical protein
LAMAHGAWSTWGAGRGAWGGVRACCSAQGGGRTFSPSGPQNAETQVASEIE